MNSSYIDDARYCCLSSWTDPAIRLAHIRDRVDALDPALRIFVDGTWDRKRAEDDFKRLARRWPEPSARPALFAVPVGVKDIFHCDGFVTRCGTRLPPALFAGPEAESVRRLKAAGALVPGKTVTTEFAFFEPGPTVNPHNPAHTPGGSSSGSAAGVAAGFFPCALGTQTVGSVIRPAAFCGVVGFKPSLGRICTDGVVPFSRTADHVGLFTRRVEEVDPLMAVLDDRWQGTEPGRDASCRLAALEGPFLRQAEPAALAAFSRTIDALAAAGIEVRSVPVLSDIADINERHMRLIAGEMARIHRPWFDRYRSLYRPATLKIIEDGAGESDSALARLADSCTRLRLHLDRELDKGGFDAWICPAATGPAPRGLSSTGSPKMNLPWTHAGLPAITVPAGPRAEGRLPLGIQLVGRFMEDERLLHPAARIESLVGLWANV